MKKEKIRDLIDACFGNDMKKMKNKIKAGWVGMVGGGGGGGREEFISTRKTSDKHNNKDPSCLR